MITVIIWWLSLEIIGLAALPFAMRLFRWLPDRGYIFSRSLGLLLVSYVVWLGASLGILRNNVGGILLALVLVSGLSVWLYLHRHKTSPDEPGLIDFLRSQHRLVITVEILFAAAFIFWVILRAYAPDKIMSSGGEKFMEIAFLNGTLNSSQFPPLDPWLSGFAISYYYFGYVMMALVTRLTGVVSGVGFDLYDAMLFALTAVGAFGIVYDMVMSGARDKVNHAVHSAKGLLYGLFGSLLVAGLGNLEGLLEALHSRGMFPQAFWTWLNIPDLANAPVTGSWYPGSVNGWWWWRASRVIQDLDLAYRPISVSPISEFPFFSFLLGDNHPHVLGLPFALLALAFAFNLLRRQIALGKSNQHDMAQAEAASAPWWNPVTSSLQGDWMLFLTGALLLGSLGFLNTWDFPIYLGVTLLAYALGSYIQTHRIDRDFLLRIFILGAAWLVTAILFYIFFYLSFGSQVGGILPYLFPPTRLPQFLVMFGIFIFGISCFLLFTLHAQAGRRAGWLRLFARQWLNVILVSLGLFILILGLVAVSSLGLQFLQGELNDPAVQGVLGGLDLSSALVAVIRSRLRDPWLFLMMSALLGLALSNLLWHAHSEKKARSDKQNLQEAYPPNDSDQFAFLILFVGLALPLSVEFFYLRDSFGVRMNTIFKFYYQAWVMLGCASAYGLWWILNPGRVYVNRAGRIFTQAGMAVLVAAGLVYPIMAIPSRTNSFQSPPNLNGASMFARNNPDDWAAIQWLRTNVDLSKGVPVILETPGRSYTYEGRISAFTGFPTVLGWAIHESQWRGNYDEQGRREPDIATIYSTTDVNQALDLLHKWHVKYIILGATEVNYIQNLCQDAARRCNLPQATRKFEQSFPLVFQQGQTAIYLVP